MKQCTRCLKYKGFTQFYKDTATKDGFKYRCTPCCNVVEKLYKLTTAGKAARDSACTNWNKSEKGIDYKRDHYLKKTYKISLIDYNCMLEEQSKVCAICNNKETTLSSSHSRVRPLAVDHDHRTGKIRGLLCTKCNAILGYCDDDIYILKNAVNYLDDRKFKGAV